MTTPDSIVTTGAIRPSELYFLQLSPDSEWSVSTKREWVRAERRAGFVNTMGQPDEPGTEGFSGNGIHGIIINPANIHASSYADQPGLLAVITAALVSHESS